MDGDTPILALDLGSTRFKAGRPTEDGAWAALEAIDAPALSGDQLVREGDPADHLETATRVTNRLAGTGWMGSVGLTSQRSTFLLWKKQDGRPVTPLISWQDRRAEAWCHEHGREKKRLHELTGLRLTPHYVGPKVAQLRRDNPTLARRLDRDELLLGTLETYLLWHWSDGAVHTTDLTMAARTMLVDLATGSWSPALLRLFGVPSSILPEIGPTCGRQDDLGNGRRLVASVADQASGLVASVGGREDLMLINLGTGGFVLAPVGDRPVNVPGYLCGPCMADESGARYAIEGTINGAGAAVDRFGPHTAAPPTPRPGAFCFPDVQGAGAPFWQAEQTLTLSTAARDLPIHEQRQVVMEGILFRVSAIVRDLLPISPAKGFILSGGLAKDPFIRRGLATLLPGPVRLLDDSESTLRGAAWLASGRRDLDPAWSEPIEPTADVDYLPKKFPAWMNWVQDELGLAPVSDGS